MISFCFSSQKVTKMKRRKKEEEGWGEEKREMEEKTGKEGEKGEKRKGNVAYLYVCL